MSTNSATAIATITNGRGRPMRFMIAGGAVVTALLFWLIARLAFGLDVRSPAFNGQHFEIGPVLVMVTAAAFSLLGWGLLAIVERITTHARLVWVLAGGIVLVLSLGAPLSGTGVTAGDRVALVLMHLAVGGILIPGLAGTVRRRA